MVDQSLSFCHGRNRRWSKPGGSRSQFIDTGGTDFTPFAISSLLASHFANKRPLPPERSDTIYTRYRPLKLPHLI